MRHGATHTETQSLRGSRVALGWIAFVAGFLLLTLAAALRADAERWSATASRTDTFSASGAIRSLALETLNGEVTINAGSGFSAKVDISIRARTESEAQKALKELTSRFENQDGELTLVQLPPGVRSHRHERGWSNRGWEGRWEMNARYTITVPASAALDVSIINGNVTTRGMTREQELVTVNGRVEVFAASGDLRARSVNGTVKAAMLRLEPKADVNLESVNGDVALTLPAKARFDLHARTMSGDIQSTFNVPPDRDGKDEERQRELLDKQRQLEEKARERAERMRERAQRDRERSQRQRDRDRDPSDSDDEDGLLDVDIDTEALNESLEKMSRELAQLSGELSRNVIINLNRSYTGAVNGGGPDVRLSNLNGRILVLAEGTSEAAARSIVRAARAFTIPKIAVSPRIRVRTPRPPAAPKPPVAPMPPSLFTPMPSFDAHGASIVQGDVTGDFTSSIPLGDITLGKVSGHVKVTTHSGQIRVAAAGKGAELYTAGGDVRLDEVNGDAKCTTLGGDLVVGKVSGDAELQTSGGDISMSACSGSAVAKTLGGDVRLKGVKGAIRAETAGGAVSCQLVGQPTEPSQLVSAGGDVTLTVPANLKAAIEIRVSGVDHDGDYVISEFPEVTISRRHGSQTGEGKLNGGGPRIVIKSSSGTVRLRKGPAV